jgi:glycosyltransferase involved in cell wall biosynthesis
VTPDFFTTLDYPLRAAWVRRAETLDPRASASRVGLVREVLRAADRYDVLVLNGSLRAEQLAAAAVGARHRSRRLVLADCTWETGGRLFERLVTRAGIRAIDRARVTYCVLSTAELASFPRSWGVDPCRMRFTPWCHTLSDEELSLPVSDGGYVFAGGDSMRDYRPLLEAAEGLAMPIRVAARRQLTASNTAVPANVTVESTTPERFTELIAAARAVVVPLADSKDRSAGQGTYLNAMALGKPVIVPDVIGVRDYIEDDRTGIIVAPRDSTAMRSALKRVGSDRERDAVREMGARARERARDRFGPERYIESLLDAIDSGRS